MAVKKQPLNNIPDDEKVEVFIPRGQANEDPNFFVSVNGVNYILPKGKRSRVPKHIAYEINRSFAAQEALDEKVQQMIEASKEIK